MSTDAIDLNNVVTLVIQHKVRGESLPQYEAWLRRAVKAARRWPGHLGVNVIRPDGCGVLFTTVVRFAQSAQLQAWIDSPDRAALIEEVQPLLEEGDHPLIHNDAEFWFTPGRGGVRPPPKWKQAVLTYLVICPLTMLVPRLWAPVFDRYPILGGVVPSNLLITLCIVLPVVFLIMPWATRLCAGWLSNE
ncbi:antibiotic biosynthesis monooxygenase [Pseudomonas sp. LFM046]|uniref:antibiotic biosynthesis monooxygenase n=1 Tax=Pseudomonas sp. LFM046 TaxID=1608357 RepID=UPI0005CFA2AB|nr:antibiotic biosynthesis monooxygenase [Pseudomonas sp. LFM046]